MGGRKLLGVLVLLACLPATAADPPLPAVQAGPDGLKYQESPRGDRIPNFSYCGYAAGEVRPPHVRSRIVIAPSGGDDLTQLQAAIDRLAAAAPDDSGWQGAVQLSPGRFQVSGSLQLHGHHVVLRGAGSGQTTIVAIGHSRRPLIEMGERGSRRNPTAKTSPALPGTPESSNRGSRVVGYVPVGAMSLEVADPTTMRVGQSIRIEHPSTAEWIAAVGMNSFPTDDGRGSWLDWKPGTIDQAWERTIVAIADRQLHFDAPLTSAIDPALSPATVALITDDANCHHVGIEHMTLVSQADVTLNPKDEEHAWDGIRIEHACDAWVRSVAFRQFAGSAVLVGPQSRRVSVIDCDSQEPVSEDAGWRRHTFHTLGQQTLFLRCHASDGRHDFSVGPLTPGPTAFVHCISQRSTAFSGPIGSWASGVLYDNVDIDGAELALTNRETAAKGCGWAAANCVLWNCVAPIVVCRKPPLANNWAIGVWGEFVGDGSWHSLNQFTTPDSLYVAQLAERVGSDAAEQAMVPSDISSLPLDVATPLPPSGKSEPRNASVASMTVPAEATGLRLQNGWLVLGDRLAAGGRQTLSWWRGSVLPASVAEFGPGITRFVPGHDELYYTDEISDAVTHMQRSGRVVLEHHWGLWYDRRRDDHQMVRRLDGDAWPPFYELPWARSGQGQAWDGLSRYDLNRFNAWYFDRLQQFATQADRHGLVLMQLMYFQHNILEAGAHWADFPWRPANCLQETGFPEPPSYENRKRVFMADAFYDVSHPVRRDLHRQYIRHCLDTLGHSTNVLFVLGEEFTGPAHFVRFWLDTIAQWEHEQRRNVLVVLSATRDVQDEILADDDYAKLVDVIDVKYWWYTKDGSLYDPPGGHNLAPRQQLREWNKSKSRSADSLARSVFEMRCRFPDKAVLCSIAGNDPWLVLAAGGSLPELPQGTAAQLGSQVLTCQPLVKDVGYALGSDQCDLLVVGTPESPIDQFTPLDRQTGRPLANGAAAKEGERPPVFWRKPASE